MPSLWMDVDTALIEIPVNVNPLVDAATAKVVDTGVTYDEAGMALVWHFTTTAGVNSATAVVPTSGADHNWQHQGGGMYTIAMPASGSAAPANNDTEGFGYFTGNTTANLPWRGPTIGFRAVAINNALIDGGDNLDVNVTQWVGTAPLALSSQRVQVDVQAIEGFTAAAMVLGWWLAEGMAPIADSGTTTTLVDAMLTQADDYWNGAMLIFRSGTNEGRTAIITDFDAGTDTLTFAPAVPDAVTTEGYVLVPGLGHADVAGTAAGLHATTNTAIAAVQTVVDALDTLTKAAGDGDLAAMLLDTAALADTVLAEITDATDIPATPTLREAITLLYMAVRNANEATATARSIKNNAGSEVLTAVMSDDGTTFSQGKLGD